MMAWIPQLPSTTCVTPKSTATELKLPGDDTTHKDGQKCGDKDATLITKVWDTRAPSDSGHIVAGPPGDIHLKDQQLITVAFVPEGTDIPKPPSQAQLDNLSDVSGATTTVAPASTVPGETTTSGPGPSSTSIPPTTAAAPTTTVRP